MRKILTLIAALSLVASLAVGGSIAYLQDTDDAVNVMTLGNVYIDQHEYERKVGADGKYVTDTIDNQTSYVLKDFTQAKPLYPAVIPNGGTVNGVTWDYDSIPVRMSQVGSHGGASVFNTPNAVDKFVTVENTGKSDAYVRTLVAFEVGTATLEDEANYPNQPLISAEIRAKNADENKDGAQPWTYGFSDYVEIDGNKYLVHELIYTGAMTSSGWKHENGVLPAGDTTYPNLCQVYMASRATNEDVKALDGNDNGAYDILVLSQAVQTNGFASAKNALDTAFGEANATNVAKWFSEDVEQPNVVDTVEEMQAALLEGGKVILGGDVTVGGDGIMTLPQVTAGDIEIDGAGFKFTGILKLSGGSQQSSPESVTIKNLNFVAVEGADSAILTADSNTTRYAHNLTVDNCTFTDPDGVVDCAAIREGTGGSKNWLIKHCTVDNTMHSLLQVKNVGGLVVDDCKVYSKNGMNLNATPNLEMTDCTFDVKGYAVRFGGDGTGANAVIKNSTLKSQCDDNDGIIFFRGGAASSNSSVTLENTTLDGTVLYTGAEQVNIITK